MSREEWEQNVENRLLHLEGEGSGFEEFVRRHLGQVAAMQGDLAKAMNLTIQNIDKIVVAIEGLHVAVKDIQRRLGDKGR